MTPNIEIAKDVRKKHLGSYFLDGDDLQEVFSTMDVLLFEVQRLRKQVVAIGGVAMDSIPRPRNTESIDRLFLELSQFTQASTAKELALQAEVERLTAWKEAVEKAEVWQPMETAPKDGTPFLAWYCKHRLDDDGDPTEEVIGGDQAIVTCNVDQWDEPEWLSAHGDFYFDDWCFSEIPILWMPLPAAPLIARPSKEPQE